MLLSVSILSIKDDVKSKIDLLNRMNIDYIHLDIMDSLFVPSKTWIISELIPLISDNEKPLDVHLMIDDIIKGIDDYKVLKPAYMTFHLEASNDPISVINYLKKNNIKAGISIKPNTLVKDLIPYLALVDLILVMGVEPGYGGQTFIPSTEAKINELLTLRELNHYSYLIEVDGGINDTNLQYCKGADMLVVGSFITNSDNYQEQINKIKN